jgi:hypothetical protein
MNPSPPNLTDDELFSLEWKIARRADELSRDSRSNPAHDLEHWQQAEREIWPAMSAAHEPVSPDVERQTSNGGRPI